MTTTIAKFEDVGREREVQCGTAELTGISKDLNLSVGTKNFPAFVECPAAAAAAAAEALRDRTRLRDLGKKELLPGRITDFSEH